VGTRTMWMSRPRTGSKKVLWSMARQASCARWVGRASKAAA
jgi:hypothetical protein